MWKRPRIYGDISNDDDDNNNNNNNNNSSSYAPLSYPRAIPT